MKNIKSIFAIAAAFLASASMVSCDDDDNDNKAVAPIFPAEQTINVTLETETLTKEFAFEANTEWTLSSSATWCQFQDEFGKTNTLRGTAGEQKVQLVISNDGQDFTEAKAELTLKMGGEEQLIATVYRAGKAYQLALFAENDTVKTLNFAYVVKENGGSINEFDIKLVSNFDWQIKEKPEWLDITLNFEAVTEGVATDGAQLVFAFNEEAARVDSIAPANVVFTNKAGQTAQFVITASYSGMPAEALEVIGAEPALIFSQDGTQYWKPSLMDGAEVDKKDAPYQLQLVTPGEYKIIYFTHKGEMGYAPAEEEDYWGYVHVEKGENGKISISLDANVKDPYTFGADGKERKSMIMALPTAVYNALPVEWGYAVLDSLLDADDFNYPAAQYEKYVIANLTQEGEAAQEAAGFVITNPQTYQPLEGYEVKSWVGIGQNPEAAIQNYGTSNVYLISVAHTTTEFGMIVSPAGYTLSEPNYTMNVAGTPFEGVFEESFGGGFMDIPMGLSLIQNKEFPEFGEFPIIFKDENDLPCAVLIIQVY